jgi:hypothetical protein
VKYSRSKTLMVILQDLVSSKAGTLGAVTVNIFLLVCKSCPGSSVAEHYRVYILPWCHLIPIGFLNYASLGIGQNLEPVSTCPCGRKVSLWRCFLAVHSFYPFPHSVWFPPPSLSSLTRWPSSNTRTLIPQQAARAKWLALKMDHHWLYF